MQISQNTSILWLNYCLESFFFIKGSERRASLYHQTDKKDDKPLKKGKKNLRKQCAAAARRFLSLCSSSASAIRASLACGY